MGIFSWIGRLLGRPRRTAARQPTRATVAGAQGVTATWQVADPSRLALRLRYAPLRNGGADAGEIVWGWVPFAESPTEGKDRPLLVVAPHDALRVYAVKLTSKAPTSPGAVARHVSIGTGPWDRQRRESWVNLDQLYSVHVHGIRREAAALDKRTFARVAATLSRRYGWRVDG
ncbi:type II toxin-antitoxin system PemK/MazF family toxin [Microbacterium sp. W1N]|uniref:type II toxin-antitoxin system PemK/MazF family toxin n=1 Tax=Microbacterium festucae TaxID=2977531 RepID=UPI0021BF6BDD|nr:type II toxin-antitoxin system PemK/MazF family toxin [Microbacterium festucae]MCT9820089.1 type II toxin-antitoxin system PemK/MazF family toxin [Microbacterium festucae]